MKSLLLAAAAGLSAACAAGPVCGPLEDESAFPEPTVSFREDVQPILKLYGCGSRYCHGGTPPTSGYSLKTCAETFGPGNEAYRMGMCNVTPGDPEQSYLVHKLEGRKGIAGVPMPEGRDPVAPEHLQIVRQWILEGARDN